MSLPDQQPVILQVIPRLEAGGAERTVIEINAALVEAGWRSMVVSAGGRHVAEIEAAGGHHTHLPVDSKNPLTMIANARRLERFIKAEGVSLIHARSRAPAWSCLRACDRAGIALVTTYHGAYGAGSAIKRWYNSSMVRGVRVIANSAFTRQQILATYAPSFPNLARQIRVIPRGADLKRFSPQQVTDEQMKVILMHWQGAKRHNGPEKPFVFLLPARMSGWKGHDVAIKAIKLLIESGHGPDLRLIFLGGHQSAAHAGAFDGGKAGRPHAGNTQTGLQDMVVKNGVGELVHFAGYCEDMASAYGAGDAVLVPSTRPEAFGRVSVEAGAMGCPVIASDHGGCRETIIAGQTGLLVPPGDPAALAGAMRQMMEMSSHQRAAMGDAARRHVRANYTTKAMCAQTITLYGEVLGRDNDQEMVLV